MHSNDTENLPREAVMSSVSYLNMLSDMPEVSPENVVPVVTKKYEDNYLRECIGSHETPCSMGINCECMFIDEKNPFVGVQFPIPDYDNCKMSNNSLCLCCLRKTTQLLFFHVIQGGMKIYSLIQKHGNICNVAGEYHPSVMLICPPSSSVGCMPLPIVAHHRNRYKVERVSGVIWLRQLRVEMEDF